jgi:protein-tyrosine-phosphatase
MPELSIKSGGIEAVQATQIPSHVREIARDWNLGALKFSAESLENLEDEILSSDLVILADPQNHEYLKQIGYKSDWVSISETAVDSSFVAVDPFGFTPNNLKIEIAKVVIGTIRLINYSLRGRKPPDILTIIPNSPSDTGIAYAHALLEKSIRNAAIIDLDMRSPSAKDFAHDFSVIEYDPTASDPFDVFDPSKNIVFTPYREFSFPEKLLIDERFLGRVRDLSKLIPVVQISAPRVTSLHPLPDSILASCDAMQVSRISC